MKEIQTADGAACAALSARWQQTSLDEVWRRASDWYTPATDALAEALCAGGDAVPPAARLAAARGRAGVGITETLDDLACLWSVHDGERPPWAVLRAVATGWAAGAAGGSGASHDGTAGPGGDVGAALVPTACLDPLSGLTTPEYFDVRLRESYGRARRTGVEAATTHCLVVVDVAIDLSEATARRRRLQPANHDWTQLGQVAALGLAVEAIFGQGAPAANLGGGVVVVLTTRGPGLGATLARLREEIVHHVDDFGVGASVRRPPRVWVERLPETHTLAAELLAQLRH